MAIVPEPAPIDLANGSDSLEGAGMLCKRIAPPMPNVNFTLNGSPTTVAYEPGMDFLEVLRVECGVVSAKNGCAPEGACGCCAVLVDGQPVLACLRKPEHMQGHE